MKKTGLGGMAGNKGGIALRFNYKDTSFVFITAHFAAGQSNVEERNRDYWTVADGLRFKGRFIKEHEYDLSYYFTNVYSYVFWLGDFNYNIDLSYDEVDISINYI
jgi:hypothetical protein